MCIILDRNICVGNKLLYGIIMLLSHKEGYCYADNKYLGKMCIRVNMNINAVIKVLIQYNSSGEWESIGYLKGRNIRSYNLPIKPKRCDHFQIRFEGYGDCKIFSISKYLETGSDTYV